MDTGSGEDDVAGTWVHGRLKPTTVRVFWDIHRRHGAVCVGLSAFELTLRVAYGGIVQERTQFRAKNIKCIKLKI